MGNWVRKTHSGALSQENQGDKNASDPVSPSKPQVIARIYCTEVCVVYITEEENEIYILVPPEEVEGERPQEHFQDSGNTPSIATNSGTSEVSCSGILEEGHLAPELAVSTAETMVRTDAHSTGLDLLCEACQLVPPEQSPKPPPETHKESSSAELTSDCSAVSEEEGATALASAVAQPVGTAEPGKGTEDLRPPADLSCGTEVPVIDQQLPGEVDLELAKDISQETVEQQMTVQRELDEAAFKEDLQRMAEPQPVFPPKPDRDSTIVAAVEETKQLTEGQTHPQNNLALTVNEMEREILEVSWKEAVPLCSSNEHSTQSNEWKLPCQTCLELTAGNTKVAPEEPAIIQRLLDDDPSPTMAVDVESHPVLALAETSGGPSGVGTDRGMKQPAQEQSTPGDDLPVAVTEMDGELSGDCFVAENVGEIAKASSSQLKMRPVETQDNIVTQEEKGDNICRIALAISLEKEREHKLTAQGLSIVQEKPNIDVRFSGGAEFLAAPELDGASSDPENLVPEGQCAVQTQPLAEVTRAQSSPKTLLGMAETRKKLEEASSDQPLAEVTAKQASSSEAKRPPETAPISETTLQVACEEKVAGFVATCKTAESQVWTGVLEAQGKQDSKDEQTQESPVPSPKLISEEAEIRDNTEANSVSMETRKVDSSSQQPSAPRLRLGSSASRA